ncbi:MAG: 4Fe-4S binding protein [Candidatus Berkelbacteria bacterium]|nr:4Fe-4S binding protein [Candidatus Berkelbacteria bacterium]
MNNQKKGKDFKYGDVMELDGKKCIACGTCVNVCQKQNVGCLKLEQVNNKMQSVPHDENPCISCGQCSLFCPANAIEAESSIKEVEQALDDRNQKVIFQFAPSIRVTVGDEFGLAPGTVTTGKIITALRKLGADMVFDTTTGADFTTTAEALETLERIKNKKNLPSLSSCCPAWVKFIKTRHPELIPNLVQARSPQVILGGLIKRDNPDALVVSIMPCTAKKAEILQKELLIDKVKPVDFVLTTREFALFLRQKGLNLANLEDRRPDTLYGLETGSGAIYGASGGVLEAVLRTGYYLAMNKPLDKLDIEEIRGLEGIKKMSIPFDSFTANVIVVNGLSNIKPVIEQIKQKPDSLTCVEVMVCPGGCIGGGGQPKNITDAIRKSRQEALYVIDKKNSFRLAHQNPIVKKLIFEEMDIFNKDKKYFYREY